VSKISSLSQLRGICAFARWLVPGSHVPNQHTPRGPEHPRVRNHGQITTDRDVFCFEADDSKHTTRDVCKVPSCQLDFAFVFCVRRSCALFWTSRIAVLSGAAGAAGCGGTFVSRRATARSGVEK